MLQKKIDCRQPTDIWLSQLIDEMCRAIKNYMRRGLKEEISLNDYSFADYESTIELVSVARFNVSRSSSSDTGEYDRYLPTHRHRSRQRQKQFLRQTASIDEETSEDNEGKYSQDD